MLDQDKRSVHTVAESVILLDGVLIRDAINPALEAKGFVLSLMDFPGFDFASQAENVSLSGQRQMVAWGRPTGTTILVLVVVRAVPFLPIARRADSIGLEFDSLIDEITSGAQWVSVAVIDQGMETGDDLFTRHAGPLMDFIIRLLKGR